jgi:hypothetical protein
LFQPSCFVFRLCLSRFQTASRVARCVAVEE